MTEVEFAPVHDKDGNVQLWDMFVMIGEGERKGQWEWVGSRRTIRQGAMLIEGKK